MNRLYPNCIPILGYKNLTLCDLDRQCYYTYPKNQFFKDLKEESDPYINELSEQAVAFLKEKRLLTTDKTILENECIQPSYFYKWKSPSLITNAIIIVSEENGLVQPAHFNKLMLFMEKLLCKHVCFFIKPDTNLDNLNQLLASIHTSPIHTIQLLLVYQEQFYSDEFGELIMSYPFIQFVILENSPFEKNIENKIFFIENKCKRSNIKRPGLFVTNNFLFSESQLHHTYFNRKLFIGSEGEIKNAPECTEAFGFIQDMHNPEQLIERIKTQAFQKYWYVNKERCEICRDCEFRHICVDNRVPYQRKNGYWYHREECNYDPYTAKWKEE